MERDDIVEYSLYNHHDEEAGKAVRKKIYFVTALLTVITVLEVLTGVFVKQSSDYWHIVKWGFIVMTVVKAAYIVMVFMHLGDENNILRKMILVTYIVFIVYLALLCLIEAWSIHNIWLQY
jgi:cytochrome c oxidase subunit IV